MAEEKLMTFFELCILSGEKCSAYQDAHQQGHVVAPNFRCKVASAVFALPVTSVLKYVSFVSSVRTAESTVDSN